jgi:hypothetical protein
MNKVLHMLQEQTRVCHKTTRCANINDKLGWPLSHYIVSRQKWVVHA